MSRDHSLRVYESILGLASDEDNPTPLVRLNRITPFKHTVVYGKLEWFNPFGAIKDRVAANMIRDAEERGALSSGKRLIEATSGNTGMGLAMLANARGYPLRTPLSKKIPVEKRTVLRFFGSDVHELDDTLCPAPGAPEGAIAIARQTAEADPEYVGLDQYKNPANPDSHYRTTGPEIWRQTQGKITHFVASTGTCGTITGTGRFLKEKNPGVKVLGAVPEDGHDIPGVRSRAQLAQTDFYRPEEYDGEVEISNRAAYDLCLRLNREESIIAGPSSGLALAGAFELVPDEPGNICVVVFADDIFKYASSVLRHFPQLVPAQEGEEAPGTSKSDVFLGQMIENLKNKFDTIRVSELVQQLENGDKPLIVDVRPPELYEGGHITGSVNIPDSDLPDRTGELPDDRDASIVMVCGIGKFSKPTTLFLKSMGYRNVRSLRGGLHEWVRKGQTMENGAE